MFSMRAHCPTVECQPIMLFEMHACFLMRTPRITVHRESLTPSSTTHPGPIATSGPIRQPSPILALSCTRTFPTTCAPAGPEAPDEDERLHGEASPFFLPSDPWMRKEPTGSDSEAAPSDLVLAGRSPVSCPLAKTGMRICQWYPG
uniref:Uncharacterized protein n=1 Tax=Triticum urartu TaxID=4572 RepID=A0A8R7PV34_TRIUA